MLRVRCSLKTFLDGTDPTVKTPPFPPCQVTADSVFALAETQIPHLQNGITTALFRRLVKISRGISGKERSTALPYLESSGPPPPLPAGTACGQIPNRQQDGRQSWRRFFSLPLGQMDSSESSETQHSASITFRFKRHRIADALAALVPSKTQSPVVVRTMPCPWLKGFHHRHIIVFLREIEHLVVGESPSRRHSTSGCLQFSPGVGVSRWPWPGRWSERSRLSGRLRHKVC